MIFLRNPGRGSRVLNTLVLLWVAGILAFTLGWQLATGAPVCPLCLMQRAAFVLAGIGLLLNVRLGPSPLHYAMVIAAAMAGLVLAGWRILMPGPDMAGTLAGWRFDTWAFAAYAALLCFAVLMLALDRKWGDNALRKPLAWPAVAVVALFAVTVLANAVAATLACRDGACRPDPLAHAHAARQGA
ncbi:disulfide bond formation protein B [Bordetella sp. 2513F-2]